MQTKIVRIPEIKLVGVPIFGNLEDNIISKSWEIFSRYEGLINWKKDTLYGLQSYSREFGEENKWFYMAAREVESFDNIPTVLHAKLIPAGIYMMVACEADAKVIRETFKKVYEDILPKSKYMPNGFFDFEHYGKNFRGMEQPNSFVNICIPVKEK